MKKKEVLKAIQQGWIHSHEEDTENEMVFRPADYDFPLSRGRSGFELKPDHKLIELNIAAADGSEEASGSWKLEISDDENMILQLKPHDSPTRQLSIRSINNDRLIVEKK
jgi:hypothetical protein